MISSGGWKDTFFLGGESGGTRSILGKNDSQSLREFIRFRTKRYFTKMLTLKNKKEREDKTVFISIEKEKKVEQFKESIGGKARDFTLKNLSLLNIQIWTANYKNAITYIYIYVYKRKR